MTESRPEAPASDTQTPPFMNRRRFIRSVGLATGMTMLEGMGTIYYTSRIEPHWLDITHHERVLPNLHPVFDGYRIVQISDLHFLSPLTPGDMQHIVQAVNDQHADFVVVTGDFLTEKAARVGEVLPPILRGLQARDGVAGILGNHDYWNNPYIVRDIMLASNLTYLNNSVITIDRHSHPLHIAGVDDIWSGDPDVRAITDTLPRDGCAILLAHEPDYAPVAAATGRFDLQLSGHTHGGQVVAPFVGPLQLPPYGKIYPAGWYQVGSLALYTNRGVGMVRPWVRLNCRPEITVLTLRSHT